MATLPSKPTKAQLAADAKDTTPAGAGLLSSGKVVYGRPRDPFHHRVVVGKIVATGPLGTEADYTDARYWVLFQQNQITNTQFRSTDPLSVKDGPTNAGTVVTSHSITEEVANTHNLSVGTLVEITLTFMDQPMPDQTSAKAQPRWIIVGGGGGSNLPNGQIPGNVWQVFSNGSNGWGPEVLVTPP